MDVAAVRAAVAAACQGVTDSLGSVVAVSAFIPDAIDPPVVYPADVSWVRDSSVPTWSAVVTVRILTSHSEDRAGQQHLNALIPALTTALDAAHGMTVQGGTGYDDITIAGVDYYGAELTVMVLPEGV